MTEKHNKSISQIVDFVKNVRQLQTTYRFTPKPDGGYENDAEHSWAVTMTCMLLADMLEQEFNTKLDQLRMLKMALIHDLAEIETGDTKTWDAQARVGKEEKERIAMHTLVESLPENLQTEMLSLWEECEQRETLEAQIVKSIDRFDPVLHRTTFQIGWKGHVEDEHATQEALDKRQLPRHKFSNTLTELYTTIRDEAIAKGMFKTD